MAKLKCIVKTLLSTFNRLHIQTLTVKVCLGKSVVTRDFPEDLVAEILSRIPIKTIARWKCVCKRWHRLLSEPYFTNLQLSRSPASLITSRNFEGKYFLRMFELDHKSDLHGIHYQDPLMSFDPGFGPGNPDWRLCGSVNGLICLKKEKDAPCICNIITRECIRLPDHEYIRNQPTTPMYGFGFVKASNEYKVVCFYDRAPSTDGLHSSWCMVYTFGTGMWRDLGQVPFLVDRSIIGRLLVNNNLFWCGSSDGIFYSGNLHWLVYDQKDVKHERVCTFDLKKEIFQLTACPQVGEMVHFRRLAMLRECLCVCDTVQLSELVIWVMKDYGKKESWSKEIVIQDQIPSFFHGVVHPLKVFEDGTILLSSYCMLFTYDPGNRTFKALDIFMEKPKYDKVVAMTFVPSFISLKSFM